MIFRTAGRATLVALARPCAETAGSVEGVTSRRARRSALTVLDLTRRRAHSLCCGRVRPAGQRGWVSCVSMAELAAVQRVQVGLHALPVVASVGVGAAQCGCLTLVQGYEIDFSPPPPPNIKWSRTCPGGLIFGGGVGEPKYFRKGDAWCPIHALGLMWASDVSYVVTRAVGRRRMRGTHTQHPLGNTTLMQDIGSMFASTT